MRGGRARKKRKGVKPTATDCGGGGGYIRGASSSSSTVEKWKGGDNHLTKVGERRGERGVKKFSTNIWPRRCRRRSRRHPFSLSPFMAPFSPLQYYVNKSPSFAVARHKSTICQANAERADIFISFSSKLSVLPRNKWALFNGEGKQILPRRAIQA